MSENTPSESMLDRVAKLIQSADDFRRHGEHGSADAALARADAIMTKHAIDAAMIASRVQDRSATERETPASVTIPFVGNDIDFYTEYRVLLGAIARHCRVKAAIRHDRQAVLVGFPSDLSYTQMLWNSVYFTFVSKLDPSWQADRPADENIKTLKEAGWKWAKIADQANAHGFPCTSNDGRLKAAYRRQCRAEGVEPTSHTQRHEAYRASYAEAFEQEITTRLWRLARASAEQVSAVPGSAVALRDRAEDVREAFFEMFPTARPETAEERARSSARLAEWVAEEEARKAKLTPAQRAAEEAKAEREERRRERQNQRNAARLQDDAGRKAGRSAAEQVDLAGTKVGREERQEIS